MAAGIRRPAPGAGRADIDMQQAQPARRRRPGRSAGRPATCASQVAVAVGREQARQPGLQQQPGAAAAAEFQARRGGRRRRRAAGPAPRRVMAGASPARFRRVVAARGPRRGVRIGDGQPAPCAGYRRAKSPGASGRAQAKWTSCGARRRDPGQEDAGTGGIEDDGHAGDAGLRRRLDDELRRR